MERKRVMRQVLPRIWNLVKLLDTDGSGEITYEELRDCPESVQNELTVLVSSDNIEESRAGRPTYGGVLPKHPEILQSWQAPNTRSHPQRRAFRPCLPHPAGGPSPEINI